MIKKFFNSLKRDGLFYTIKKVFRYIKYKIIRLYHRIFKKQLLKGVNIYKYDAIIIFENNFGWNKLMKQRPQQIAENFGNNILFIYHSHDDNDYLTKKRIRKIKDNLFLIDLGYYRNELINDFAFHNNKYVMIYSTDYIPLSRIKMYKSYRYKLIYDYVDNIDVKLCGKKMFNILIKRHKTIIKDNDNIIITTANKLYENVKMTNANANVNLITNGVTYEHFKNVAGDVPSDLLEIRKKYKNIIGYYGALASWFDYDLIKHLANVKKECAIVLLGLDYDKSIDESGILNIDNVFYLGKKSYNELPNYVKSFDVCTIPFLINEITLSTSPVKLFEYMAANKPIVTTALPECKKYDTVLISTDKNDFIDKINLAISKNNDSEYIKKLDEEALNNTWKKKCLAIDSIINDKKIKIKKLQEMLKRRLDSGEIDRIIIWRSSFGWDVPLFQRPQHIANAFSRKRCLLLYEVSEKTDGISQYGFINDNLILVNLNDQFVLDAVSCIIDLYNLPKYVQIYSTNWDMSCETMKLYIKSGYKILYEYIDELSPELAGTEKLPDSIINKYNYMLKDTNNVLVVVTANRIEADLLKNRGNKNYCFACNGVDYKHFMDIDKSIQVENEYLNIINNGKINVGYYGALAKWFDYDLIRKMDECNKYNIILFGVKYDNSFDKSKIENLKNVHYCGTKKYEILPCYASLMDILTIPFIINDITLSTSPLKLFEYMALHKPIVTSAMPECKKYKSVLIGENHEEFIKKIDEAFLLKNDDKYLDLLDKEALENTWDSKAEEIIKLLKTNEKSDK